MLPLKPHSVQILLAVYNGENYIQEQIASILSQSYSDIHLIIRDNCSTDQTVQLIEKLCKQHPEKISLICSPTNDGVIGNFAKLAEASKSPYIMFSDADDVWHIDKIEKCFQKMKAMEHLYGKENPLLVHTDLTVVNRNLQTIHPSFWKYSKLDPVKGNSLKRQLVQNTITGCTTMLNRPLLDLALPFPETIVMHDWWLGLVATAMGHVECVHEPTMLYRQHGNNDTGAKRYSLNSFFYRFKNQKEREKIFKNRELKYQQADVLKSRYSKKLSIPQKELLDNFISLKNASFFRKRYAILKHGFFKQGFLRNVLELLPLEFFQ